MSEADITELQVEIDGEPYSLFIESCPGPRPVEINPEVVPQTRESLGLTKGVGPVSGQKPPVDRMAAQAQALQQRLASQKLIRGYVTFALQALQNLGTTEIAIDEVVLKFGIKLSGTAGIPLITQGTAESNLEIQVKCKFPAANG